MPKYPVSVRLFIYILIGIVLSACLTKTTTEDAAIKQRFKLLDSLSFTGKADSVKKLVSLMRPLIKTNDPAICDYYCLKAEEYRDSLTVMRLYTDSATAFFSISDRVNRYPDRYFKVLLLNGDFNFLSGKYDVALNAYYKAKKQLLIVGCDDGTLASKMASIYFKQKNFRLAAQYLAEGYHKLNSCGQKHTREQLFYLTQAALDNTGYVYEKAGMLDSAMYYLNLDKRYIDSVAKSRPVNHGNLNAARFVLYDNLAGVNLLKGNYAETERYIQQAFALPNSDVREMRLTPDLKLAEAYLLTGRFTEADSAFKKSRRLLDMFYKGNFESNFKWDQLYAQYLFKLNQPAQAYIYQGKYIKLKDSLDNNSSKIYQLNVENELATIQKQQDIEELKRQDSIKLVFTIGITVVAFLSVIIIVLINRNLKQSHKNYQVTTLQNEQLQTTLAELERANKNYIRIMRVMAHDLRNPLSGMIGLATVLLDEEEFSEDSRHMLQLIETTGIHSIEMINELLKSGLADENEVVEKQALDIKALLQDSVELLQFKANEKKQKIEFLADEGSIMVAFNHEKIWRVFNNLIVNAIKFSYEGGIIKAAIKSDGSLQLVTISIADGGIGISDKDKDSIFEMFTPAKKAGTNGEQPFGLGLSISKKIIEKHGGKIWFESAAGSGTTFYIELPVQ